MHNFTFPNSAVKDDKNNIYKNSPGWHSMQPINKSNKNRDLVLSKVSQRDNFFGLGGLYNM